MAHNCIGTSVFGHAGVKERRSKIQKVYCHNTLAHFITELPEGSRWDYFFPELLLSSLTILLRHLAINFARCIVFLNSFVFLANVIRTSKVWSYSYQSHIHSIIDTTTNAGVVLAITIHTAATTTAMQSSCSCVDSQWLYTVGAQPLSRSNEQLMNKCHIIFPFSCICSVSLK